MSFLYLTTGFGCIAATILTQKFVLRTDVPLLLMLLLRTLAPGILLFLPYLKGNFGKLHRVKALFAWPFWLLTLGTMLLPLFLKTMAHQQMNSAKFALLGSLDPFVTAVLMALIFGQAIDLSKCIGVALAVMGAILLAMHRTPIDQASAVLLFSWPELLTILALILGRLGWLASQHCLQQQLLNTTELNIVFMLIPGIITFVMAILHHSFAWLWQASWSWELIIGLLLSAGFNSLGCILLTQSLQHFDPLTISVMGTSIVPTLVAIGSYWFYAEAMSWYWASSIACILVGVAIFSWPQKVRITA